MWGVALRGTGLIGNIRDSVYFSVNTYATIGYGEMVLPYNWRELSPLMAISGLFALAWTAGEMFNIVESHRQLVEDLTASRDKRKAEMKRARTRASEQAHALDTHEEAGLTREQWRALREEIETKLQQLHDAERAEIEALRRHCTVPHIVAHSRQQDKALTG